MFYSILSILGSDGAVSFANKFSNQSVAVNKYPV